MHLASIFILCHQWTLIYFLLGRHIMFSTFIQITVETVHIYNAHAMASWLVKYFIFVGHICSFTYVTLFSIPYLPVIFFANAYDIFTAIYKHITFAYEVFTAIIKHITFHSHTCSSYLWPPIDSLFDKHILISLFMPISLEIVHMYICHRHQKRHTKKNSSCMAGYGKQVRDAGGCAGILAQPYCACVKGFPPQSAEADNHDIICWCHWCPSYVYWGWNKRKHAWHQGVEFSLV